MADISKQQLRQIILKAPEGTTPAGLIDALQKRGHVIEGLAAITPPEVKVPAQQKPQGNFFQQEVEGGAQRGDEGFFKGLGKDIFQSTVGSKGLLGVAQLPGKVIGQAGALKSQTQTSESTLRLSQETALLIKRRREETNPLRREQMTKTINANLQIINEGNQAVKSLDRFTVTPGQALGTAGNAALTVSTLGTGNVVRSGAVATTRRLAPGALPAVERGLTAARGVVPKAIEGGLAAAGFKASSNIAEEKPITEDTFSAFLLGAGTIAGFSGAGAVKDKALQSVSNLDSRIINSLIKPGKNAFSYGKNPGRGVAQEGITASSLDDLGTKVTARKQAVGQELEQTLANNPGSINVSDTLSVIDDAITDASKFPDTNAALITRLNTLKNDLSNRFGTAKSMTPAEAAAAKREIGQLAKWTGNASDDEVINATTQKVYGKINDQINDAVPDVADLNNRYGNLLAAEKAIQYRTQAQEKLNLLGLGDLITGLGVTAPAAIALGNIPGALAGLSVVAVKKALSSVRGKTTMAKWFSKADPAAKKALIEKIPVLRNLPEGATIPTLIKSLEEMFD